MCVHLEVFVHSQVYWLCGFRRGLTSLFHLSEELQQVKTEDLMPL